MDTLGKPRPTSIDVLLSRPDRRVAVEWKFTEVECGTCSRPGLQPGDAACSTHWCDGYRAQAGRGEQCALTVIGVRYWDYLRRLFAWPADRHHEPYHFVAVCQLTRNALATMAAPDGVVDPARGADPL